MLCQFEKVIFPRDATASVNGFMIAVYKPCGSVRDAAGRMLDNFKAVGYGETIDALQYKVHTTSDMVGQEGEQTGSY